MCLGHFKKCVQAFPPRVSVGNSGNLRLLYVPLDNKNRANSVRLHLNIAAQLLLLPLSQFDFDKALLCVSDAIFTPRRRVTRTVMLVLKEMMLAAELRHFDGANCTALCHRHN